MQLNYCFGVGIYAQFNNNTDFVLLVTLNLSSIR